MLKFEKHKFHASAEPINRNSVEIDHKNVSNIQLDKN